MTWRQVQQAYNNKGLRISKAKARLVMGALPAASVATGWSEERVLKLVIGNGDVGFKRLMTLVGGNDAS